MTSAGEKEITLVSNGEKLYLTFAVPKIERLKGFRPKFKLVGPEGNVIVEFSTKEVEPSVYYEGFVGTYEWKYFEDHFETVPGKYRLIVEYDEAGKFWIAVGKIERSVSWI